MGQSTANSNYGLPSGVKNWYDPAPRGKRYDYFTGALPWPQKGPAVDLPLGGNAPVFGLHTDSVVSNPFFSSPGKFAVSRSENFVSGYSNVLSDTANTSSSTVSGLLYADMSKVTLATINSLRQAFMLQRYYEIDARDGVS